MNIKYKSKYKNTSLGGQFMLVDSSCFDMTTSWLLAWQFRLSVCTFPQYFYTILAQLCRKN